MKLCDCSSHWRLAQSGVDFTTDKTTSDNCLHSLRDQSAKFHIFFLPRIYAFNKKKQRKVIMNIENDLVKSQSRVRRFPWFINHDCFSMKLKLKLKLIASTKWKQNWKKLQKFTTSGIVQHLSFDDLSLLLEFSEPFFERSPWNMEELKCRPRKQFRVHSVKKRLRLQQCNM